VPPEEGKEQGFLTKGPVKKSHKKNRGTGHESGKGYPLMIEKSVIKAAKSKARRQNSTHQSQMYRGKGGVASFDLKTNQN